MSVIDLDDPKDFIADEIRKTVAVSNEHALHIAEQIINRLTDEGYEIREDEGPPDIDRDRWD